jgi:16S rRNA (adenine1518-N6/adenine1519-N6)-dimethyltransferase
MSLKYDPSNPDVVRSVLLDLGAAPNRTLGQNFLIDAPALDAIVQAANVQTNDVILEIGPGLGALTVRLLKASNHVTAIEKDRKYAEFMRRKLKSLTLIEADALDLAWEDLNLPDQGVKIVANLPYSISKPILRRFVEDWRPYLHSATILVQREVANRLVAPANTKEYGPLSIMTALYCRTTKVFDIPPTSFVPPPNVMSTVVHMEMLPEPTIALRDEKRFWTTVRAAFSQRRKTLGNTLKPLAPKEKLARAFENSAIDPMRRGETLSPQEFATLTESIFDDKPVEISTEGLSASSPLSEA